MAEQTPLTLEKLKAAHEAGKRIQVYFSGKWYTFERGHRPKWNSDASVYRIHPDDDK